MIELRVEPGIEAASALAQVKTLAWEHQGAHELQLLARRVDGSDLRLTLGTAWLYSGSPQCLAALAEFGEVALR